MSLNRTKIDWGYGKNFFTWNVVTGCPRGCPYCYARRIHERFNSSPFSETVYHPGRIHDPSKHAKPCTIFVGSMSDIEFWNHEWTQWILNEVERCPRHTFMFLSKNPRSYGAHIWPENTMQGLTMDCTQTRGRQMDLIYQTGYFSRPFLSIEPLLGPLKVKIPLTVEKVIVGFQTGPGAKPPLPEWVQSVKENVPENHVFWKPSTREK